MGRSSMPPALLELTNPSSPEAQVNALRSLKNELIGHDQRKELAIRHGVVKPLVEILKAEARKGGKRRKGTLNGTSRADEDAAFDWSVEDELRYQAILVVGSLALGGPGFVAPLLAGHVLDPLLETLSPAEVPAKLVVATLRSLLLIVDAIELEKPWRGSADGPLQSSSNLWISDRIYNAPDNKVIESLAEILGQTSKSPTIQEEQSLAMQLIIKTCRGEQERHLLFEAGILDILATKLAAIALADAQALRMEPRNSAPEEMHSMYLPDILEAIGTIVQKSNYRTASFLYSPSIRMLFYPGKDDTTGAYGGYGAASQDTPWERLIPRLHSLQSRSDPYAKTFPPLGSLNWQGGSDSFSRLPSMEFYQQTSRNVPMDEFESPLATWLIYVARRSRGRERLAACWVLGLLRLLSDSFPSEGPPKAVRERFYSYSVVPLVAMMIEEVNPMSETSKADSLPPKEKQENRYILERAPAVLATIIKSNAKLQAAAVHTKIMPVLCQILKKSFDPIITSSKPLWSPKPASAIPEDPMIDPASSTLGNPGLSPDILHALRYRESSLKAIAAITESEDGIRKSIVEMGVVASISDSLVPYSHDSSDLSSSTQPTAKDGNPISVIIAALKAVRSLSRSVSVLRTSLIDHGIAKPTVALAGHPDVEVQITATEVLINLVLEFFPERAPIIASGVASMLCMHCHSANYRLRLSSLWALQHVVLNADNELKIKCLEDMGVGWLVQIISGEPRDFTSSQSSASTPIRMGTPNAAGEQVDMLNAVDDPSMDVDEDSSSEDEDNTMADSLPLLRNQKSRRAPKLSFRARLKQIKDAEDPRVKAVEEDICIQEHALHFIRNFTSEGRNSGVMIDHLLDTIGHSRFFELLDSKLRPRTIPSSLPSYTTPSTRPFSNFSQTPNTSSTTPIYNRDTLLSATIHVLVHLANGRPSQRSLLINQTQLMTHLLPLFSHPNPQIRLTCCFFMNNITWQENEDDFGPSKERALALRNLGFEGKLKEMGKDGDKDVRERSRLGLDQMAKLLDGRDGGFGGLGGASAGSGPLFAEGLGTAAAGSGASLLGLRGGMHGGSRAWNRE